MDFKRDKIGFTLLELIVALIILSALIALAVPRFYRMIERTRGTEAMIHLDNISKAIQRCLLIQGSDNRDNRIYCTDNFTQFMDYDPSTLPKRHFDYGSISMNGDGSFHIVAWRNFFELGVPMPSGTASCPSGDAIGVPAGSGFVLCVDATWGRKIIGYGFYEGM